MSFVPNLNWVDDAPPGFMAAEMKRIQLGIADASTDAAAAVAASNEALTIAQSVQSEGASVTAFGAVGDGETDDTAAIQAAIGAASELGVAVYIPPGRYRITDTLHLTSGTTLRGAGRGSTVIDVTGLGAGLGSGKTAIQATGTLGPTEVSISADVARGAKSATVVSAAGLTVGDVVLLSSDDLFHTAAALKRGEIKRIEQISGTTVTFEDAAYDSYTAASAAKLTVFSSWLRSITLESFTMEGTDVDNMERGVYIYGAEDVRIRDCTFNHLDWNSVNLRNVVNFDVSECTFRNVHWVDNGPNYYGLVVENGSAHGRFTRNHGTKCRHLFTTGYTTTTPGVTRYVVVADNNDTYSQSASFDTHNGSEYITFIGNTSSFSEAGGINVEGRNTYVVDNVITNFATTGVLLRDGADSCTVRGNRISGNLAGTVYGVWVRKTHESFRPRRNVITDNIITANSRGVFLDNADNTTVANNIMPGAFGSYAIWVDVCTRTRIVGNSCDSAAGFAYLQDSTQTLVESNDAGSGQYGVRQLGEASDNTLVVGNDFSQNTTPVFNLLGTNKVAHNLGVATHNA